MINIERFEWILLFEFYNFKFQNYEWENQRDGPKFMGLL